MTAGQDARAAQLIRSYMLRDPATHPALVDAITVALSEARDQGARDRDTQIIEACRRKGNGGVPFITELTAKLPLPSAAPDIFAESAKNTSAPAPNPHLGELTALSQEMGLYDTPGTARHLTPSEQKVFHKALLDSTTLKHPGFRTPSPALAPLREAVGDDGWEEYGTPEALRRSIQEEADAAAASKAQEIYILATTRAEVSEARAAELAAALSGIIGPAARCVAGRHGHIWDRLRTAMKAALAALSSAQGSTAEGRNV